MNLYHNLDPAQATHFASLPKGGRMVIIVPLPKQPPEDWVIGEIDLNTIAFTDGLDEHDSYVDIQLPYPRVGLREAWCKCGDRYYYKADYTEDELKESCTSLSRDWRSAQSMPTEAIDQRGSWGKATDVRVDRVQEITIQEIIDSGTVPNAYISQGEDNIANQLESLTFKAFSCLWFNHHYSKPRPRYKNGEIIGYECWAWDLEEWLDKYDKSDVLTNQGIFPLLYDEGSYHWKRKPLTIHIDPWVAITTIEKE